MADREREARDVLGEALCEFQHDPSHWRGVLSDLGRENYRGWAEQFIIARLAEAGYAIVKGEG